MPSLIHFFGHMAEDDSDEEDTNVCTVQFVGTLKEPTWQLNFPPWPVLPRLQQLHNTNSNKTSSELQSNGDDEDTERAALASLHCWSDDEDIEMYDIDDSYEHDEKWLDED